MADPASFEARVDALYALPLDAFVAERKRVAGELKRDGAAAEARAFAGLAKPTLSAWLTNQTTRHAPELVRELLKATDAVAAAQKKRAAAPDFAEAVAAQRGIIAQLAQKARAVVTKGSAVGGADLLDRVENNFRWGAIAGPDREALAGGRLIRDVVAPGFGGFGDAVPDEDARPIAEPAPHPPPSASTVADKPASGRGAKADARREAEVTRARARAAAEAERAHRRLVARHQAALRDAQGETARARRDLARAERARDAADQRLAVAEAELASARQARDAAEQHRREAADAVATQEAAEATLRRSQEREDQSQAAQR